MRGGVYCVHKGSGWAIMVKYTHLSVVGDMHIDSGDSYGVQRVPDTRKTTKIPLPNSFPSKNPTTIPGVPKNYGYRGPKHRHVVDIFQKYFTHNLPTHYTNGSVSQNRISRIFNFSVIPPSTVSVLDAAHGSLITGSLRKI